MALTSRSFRRLVAEHSYLFRDPNVLSIGIGHKVKDSAKTKRLALVITVRKKVRHEKTIPVGYLVPKRITAEKQPGKRPNRYLATDVVQHKPKRFSAGPAGLMGAAIKVRGGSTQGTLGCFVRDQLGGYFALSCAHVLTDFGRVVTPGTPVEWVANGKSLGFLARHSPLRSGLENPVDVALARVTASDLLGALTSSQPIVLGIGSLNINDPVTIIGSVSGQNTGVVKRLEVQERVFGYGGNPSEYCIMIRQIEVEALGAAGDSGSLCFDAHRQAVGLFIADNGNLDLVTPIKRALAFVGEPSAVYRAPNDSSVMRLSFV